MWRERERLLEDVRGVSAALATLADEATERFPAADAGALSQATAAFPMAFGPNRANSVRMILIAATATVTARTRRPAIPAAGWPACNRRISPSVVSRSRIPTQGQ